MLVRVARARPLVDRRQTHFRHQPSRTESADLVAYTPQMPRHLPTAVSLSIDEGVVHYRH